ncbi:MAG: hypothetical protein ABJA80_10410, partial [bacterium]
MTPGLRRAMWCVAVAGLAACGTTQAHLAEPIPAGRTEWTPLMLQAAQESAAGRYAVADQLLADFSTRYPASVEASDALYWRAVYKLDPGNSASTPRDAGVLLDGYLASGATAHRTEAHTLRRVATALDARATAVATPPKVDVVKVDDKVRDEEIQRLKDELAKANAELDRIKRRL